MLIGRFQGPLTFRFILQPLTAVILAIRVAVRDVRQGRPPYLLWPNANSVGRSELIRLARQDIGKVFVLAFVLDVLYALIVYRSIYPGQALIVAVSLAVVPYLVVRGPMTRLLLRIRATRKPHN